MMALKSGVSRLRVDDLSFSPDGTVLAAAGLDGVCLWPLPATGAKAEFVRLPVVVSRTAFAPDGRTLFAGHSELCAVSLWDRTAVPVPFARWLPLWFGVSPDGSRLVVSEEHRGGETSRVTGWDVGEYREPAWEVAAPGRVWSRPLFAPDGKTFVSCEHRRGAGGGWVGHRVTRSASTGRELDASPPLGGLPEFAARSPDGRTLACRTGGVIRVYPAEGKWGDAPVIADGSGRHVTGMAFHPGGRFLAATSNDATVKLYDTETWALARTLTWDIGKLRSVAFSPDGLLAAAGGDTGKVVVWDVDA